MVRSNVFNKVTEIACLEISPSFVARGPLTNRLFGQPLSFLGKAPGGRATVLVVKSWGIILLPWSAMFDHGVQHREQLTHTRGQGDLGGRSCTAHTRIEALED